MNCVLLSSVNQAEKIDKAVCEWCEKCQLHGGTQRTFQTSGCPKAKARTDFLCALACRTCHLAARGRILPNAAAARWAARQGALQRSSYGAAHGMKRNRHDAHAHRIFHWHASDNRPSDFHHRAVDPQVLGWCVLNRPSDFHHRAVDPQVLGWCALQHPLRSMDAGRTLRGRAGSTPAAGALSSHAEL